jgi:uncharacterized protein
MRVWQRLPARHASWPVRHDIDPFVSAAHDDPEAAMAMLAADPDLAAATSSWGETALQAASHLGHRELIARLIDKGAELDVFAATAMGDMEGASELLEDTSPDACGVHSLPLLHFGVVSRDLAMLQMLLRAGVALNPKRASLSPLHSAVGIGSVPMIRVLVAAGVDCAVTDAFGATALDWAHDVEDRGSVLAVFLSGYLRRAAADLMTAG